MSTEIKWIFLLKISGIPQYRETTRGTHSVGWSQLPVACVPNQPTSLLKIHKHFQTLAEQHV